MSRTTGAFSRFVRSLSVKPTAEKVLSVSLKLESLQPDITASIALENRRYNDPSALNGDEFDKAAARLDDEQDKRLLKRSELLSALEKQYEVLKQLEKDIVDQLRPMSGDEALAKDLKEGLKRVYGDLVRLDDQRKLLEDEKKEKINLNPALAPQTDAILNSAEKEINRVKRNYGPYAAINRRIAKLETVAASIKQDIQDLETTPGVDALPAEEKKRHDDRVEKLKIGEAGVQYAIGTLKGPKMDNLSHAGEYLPKGKKTRSELMDPVEAVDKMELAGCKKMRPFKAVSTEALEKICAANNNSNSTLNALRDNIKALNGAMLALQKVAAKMVTPRAINAYLDEYNFKLKEAQSHRAKLCAQLNDPAVQTLVNQAVRDTGKTEQERADNQKKLFELTCELEAVNALLQDIVQNIVLENIGVRGRLSFKKETIPPLGHNPDSFFSYTAGKTNKDLDSDCIIMKWDRDAKTGQWTQSIALDSNGNRLQPTLKEINKVISEVNAERKIQAEKTGRPYVPITLQKDLFGKGYTINCFNGKEDENTKETDNVLKRLEMEIAKRPKPVSAQVAENTPGTNTTVAEAARGATVAPPVPDGSTYRVDGSTNMGSGTPQPGTPRTVPVTPR